MLDIYIDKSDAYSDDKGKGIGLISNIFYL